MLEYDWGIVSNVVGSKRHYETDVPIHLKVIPVWLRNWDARSPTAGAPNDDQAVLASGPDISLLLRVLLLQSPVEMTNSQLYELVGKATKGSNRENAERVVHLSALYSGLRLHKSRS
jgi:hypothetical protein